MGKERTKVPTKIRSSRPTSEGISKTIRKIGGGKVSTIAKVLGKERSNKPKTKGKVLADAIPDVVQWVRELMDTEIAEPGASSHGRHQDKKTSCTARSFAQKIIKTYDVRILLNGSKYWRGETRMWENVCAFAAKLPGEGEARNIFDAMSRYPSSRIVYSGLKLLYGRHVVVADKKLQRISLPENAIALFSPTRSDGTIAKKWFEPNTLTRMQELVVHMSAVSEYILRCAYQCKEENEDGVNVAAGFLSSVERRIKYDLDCKNRKVLRFESWDPMAELSAGNLSSCLEKSLVVAHGAVIEGAKMACRRYTRKGRNGSSRLRIQLWMLKRPLPDIMDALINRLETVLLDLLGSRVDFDMFRVHAMRHLRSVDLIFTEVSNSWFKHELDFEPPAELPKNAEALVSTRPYTYGPSRG